VTAGEAAGFRSAQAAEASGFRPAKVKRPRIAKAGPARRPAEVMTEAAGNPEDGSLAGRTDVEAEQPMLAVEALHAEWEARAAQGAGEPPHRRMAAAVLARADAGTREGARFDPASGRLISPHDEHEEEDELEAADRRGSNRVDDWVRPQYADEPEVPAGDYWTPVPESTYRELDGGPGADYGWPVPVERLRAVPSGGYDDDPVEEAEPTRVVPQWPPAQPSDRVELPRAWSDTDGPMNRRPLDAVSAQRWSTADDDGRDGWRRNHGPADDERWPADHGAGAEGWNDGHDELRPDGRLSIGERWAADQEHYRQQQNDRQENDRQQQHDRQQEHYRQQQNDWRPGDDWRPNDDREGRAMWPSDDPDQRPRRRAVIMRRGNRPDADPASRGRQAREPRDTRRRVTTSSATEHIPMIADSTQMLPAFPGQDPGGEPRRRPRPRPNPQADARSTVYVSRHAAEPS
jgi:hypothetical protein